MTTVQITIRDRSYACALCELLVADGQHSVHVLDYPHANLDGIVVADEDLLDRLAEAEQLDPKRCVIFIQQLDFDADKLFSAGIRHVIPVGCSPEVGRLIVIAAERRLAQVLGGEQEASIDKNSLFDAEDKLFLQSLGIGTR